VYDIDSDNDGITDNIEGQPTSSYVVPTNLDTDGDGLVNAYDFFNGIGGNGLTPYDHDADGMPDYRDLDTDNDGAPDRNEGDKRYISLAQTTINSSTDSDGDGLMDIFDTYDYRSQICGVVMNNVGMSQMGPLGNFEGPTPSGSLIQLVRSSPMVFERDWRNATILSLQILDFSVRLNNKIAVVKWNVVNEEEIKHYKIEQSLDGVNFMHIATVAAQNMNNAEYKYNDDVSLLANKIIFYRIRQVDKSGGEYLTKVVTVNYTIANDITFSVYPNPVVDLVNVKIESPVPTTADITLSDASGRVVLVTKSVINRGMNLVQLKDLTHLAKGMYWIKIVTPDKIYTEKVVKD
jgi:hypothetical protein